MTINGNASAWWEAFNSCRLEYTRLSKKQWRWAVYERENALVPQATGVCATRKEARRLANAWYWDHPNPKELGGYLIPDEQAKTILDMLRGKHERG